MDYEMRSVIRTESLENYRSVLVAKLIGWTPLPRDALLPHPSLLVSERRCGLEVSPTSVGMRHLGSGQSGAPYRPLPPAGGGASARSAPH